MGVPLQSPLDRAAHCCSWNLGIEVVRNRKCYQYLPEHNPAAQRNYQVHMLVLLFLELSSFVRKNNSMDLSFHYLGTNSQKS